MDIANSNKDDIFQKCEQIWKDSKFDDDRKEKNNYFDPFGDSKTRMLLENLLEDDGKNEQQQQQNPFINQTKANLQQQQQPQNQQFYQQISCS